MAVTIQLRRDTHANLNSANPNIASGEIIIDTTNNRAVVNSTSSTLAYNTAIAAGQFLTLDDSNGRTLGGGANEVQLSVKGASTQGDPIFQVTDNGGTNKIFSVTDNDTTICTIENHGDTADKVVQIIGQAAQKADGSGGSLLEVITQSGDTTGLFVDNEGNVSILPADGEGEQAALLVRGSSAGDADAKIFEVQDENENQEFLVNDTGTTVAGTLGVTGETTATGGIKVDDITEATTDHGIDIAKPISVTGNISASDGSKLLIQNHRGQTIITQSNTQSDFSVANDTDDADLPNLTPTKITPLSVTITPTFADSKILIEFAVYGNYRTGGNSGGGDLGGTLVRSISGGATDEDLAGTNTSSAVKALFFGSNQGRTDSADGRANSNFHGHFLDSPSTTSAVTYVFGVKGGGLDSNVSGTYNLNKSSINTGDNNLLINFHSTIIATEIPQ